MKERTALDSDRSSLVTHSGKRSVDPTASKDWQRRGNDGRWRQRRPTLVKPLEPELETRSAEYWQSRAEEARAAAEQISDPFSRQTMENIAKSYDKLADWAKRRCV